MDIGLVKRQPLQWLPAWVLAAFLLPPPGFAAQVKEAGCLDVFADQAYLRRSDDLGLAREWIASRAGKLSFAANTAIATEPKVLSNPALTGLLKRYAHPSYGGRPWIRVETPARAVSLQHEKSYWDTPEWRRADFSASEASMQFVSTPTRTFLVIRSTSWEVWPAILPPAGRIAVYEWRRNKFVYVDAEPEALNLACSACSSEHLRPSMISYMDVWVFKKTGHLFVTDMAGNSTLVFRPDGRYWGRLLLDGLDRFRKELRDPAEPEVFPKLCHRGKSLIIRGPRLARVVDDAYAEAVDEVVIGAD